MSVRIPPRPILVAADRWLRVLPDSGGVPRAQSLLNTHSRYNDLTPTQYATALAWLRELGLLENPNSDSPSAQRILAAIFEKAPPPWFQDADDLIRTPDDLPSDIATVGETLGIPPESVYQQLAASWGKVDAAVRAALGAAGELALVELLRAHPAARVEHVAAWSDGFGYDIEVRCAETLAHLEVKSSTRSGRFTAYLSRHEYAVMTRDESWVLVLVRLTADHQIDGVGSVPREWITANIPVDTGPNGSWAAVKLDIPSDAIRDLIPSVASELQEVLPHWR